MSAWLALTAFLNQPAVNLSYHLLLAAVLALAALAAARPAHLAAVGRAPSLTLGLLALLHLGAAALVTAHLVGLVYGHALLPPFDRAVTTLDLLALGIAFNFPTGRSARLGTLGLTALTLAALVVSWLFWVPAAYSGAPAYYNGSLQDTAWLGAQVVLITLHLLLLAWQGPAGWPLAALALLALFAGEGAHYLWPIGNSDLPTSVHLAALVAWPVLAGLLAVARPRRVAHVIPPAEGREAVAPTLPVVVAAEPLPLTEADTVETPVPAPAYPAAFERRRADRRASVNQTAAEREALARQLAEAQSQLEARAANVSALQTRVEAQARQIAALRTELDETPPAAPPDPAPTVPHSAPAAPYELRPAPLPTPRPSALVGVEPTAKAGQPSANSQPAVGSRSPGQAPHAGHSPASANTTARPRPATLPQRPSEGLRLDLALPASQDLCPHLGLANDPDSRQAFASHNNRCYGCPSATEITLSHQDHYCLGAAHAQCPVFTGATPNPRPPIGASHPDSHSPRKAKGLASLFGGKADRSH